MTRDMVVTDIVARAVGKASTDSFQSCIQCGLCAGICPWHYIDGNLFNIRKLIRLVQTGGEGFEKDEIIYACTTCNLCGSVCPRGVQIVDLIRGARKLIADTGFNPSTYRNVLYSIRTFGNPWSQEREKRVFWRKDLNVPYFREGMDYLLYTCCTTAFDLERQKTLISLARVLKKAGVSFGIIGEDENCCGEAIRKIGGEEEFQSLRKSNIRIIKELGAKKIITISPHCHYVFKYEYPGFEDEVKIIHYTELLDLLIKEGHLEVNSNSVTMRISYHDPCYLGRYSKIYDAPRNVINNIKGVELIELSRTREKSLCCGGGGGGIWLGGNNGKLSDLRIEDAMQKEVDVLTSACPYCLSMLAYSNEIMGQEIRVMDLVELVDLSS